MVQLRIFVNFRNALKPFSDDEKGRLFDAMLAYAEDKTVLPLPGNERFIWGWVKGTLDAQHESYEAKCESAKKARDDRSQNKNSEIRNKILKSEEDNLSLSNIEVQEQVQVQDKLSQEKVKKRESSAFRAPSVDEVRAYCSERGNDVDPEHFVAYYQSNGWKVGRNPMKDWKAAVRSWEKRDLERGEPKTTNQFLQLLMEEGGHL